MKEGGGERVKGGRESFDMDTIIPYKIWQFQGHPHTLLSADSLLNSSSYSLHSRHYNEDKNLKMVSGC